jgi:ABC-type transport system involved in multi-copper enzyme maturation permease subunit
MSDNAIDEISRGLAANVPAEVTDAWEAETPASRGPGAARAVLLMARVTFREAARRKILWIAAIAGFAFLALFWIALHAAIKSSVRMPVIARHEGMQVMTMMVLYAGSMLTSLMAALTSCDALAGEIASGSIHAIATKPVSRASIVLGKWAGFAGMITLYVLLVEGGSIAIAAIEGGLVAPHSGAVLGLIWLQAMVLLDVTLAASTRFSSLTSGAITLGLYGLAFVGGWIEAFGAVRHVPTCVNLGIVSSLIMPSDALWRRAAYLLQPPLLGAAGASPFASSSIPSHAMAIYAVLYAACALILAQVLLASRDI